MRERNTIKELRFREMFEAKYVKLYYSALNIVGNEDDARDIVDEYFATLWESYDPLSDSYNNTFLYNGVQRKCLDHLKHNKVRNRYESYVRDHNDSVAYMLAHDESEDERLETIRKVIDDMPQKTRFVLDKCYMEGCKYVEVAEMMGISRDGVRKHITKALQLLRAAFVNDGAVR